MHVAVGQQVLPPLLVYPWGPSGTYSLEHPLNHILQSL